MHACSYTVDTALITAGARSTATRGDGSAFPSPAVLRAVACAAPDRVLYAWAEPLTTFLDIAQRNDALSVAQRLAPSDAWLAAQDASTLGTRDAFVQAVVSRQADVLQLREHMCAWLTAPVPAPTLALGVASVSQPHARALLADFLGVPPAGLDSLGARASASGGGSSVTADGGALPAAFTGVLAREGELMRMLDGHIRLPPAEWTDRLPADGLRG